MHKILRLPDVMKATGLPRSTIYQKVSLRRFPYPIPLGPKSVGWLESDVQNWILERLDQSKAQTEERENG